MADHIWKEKGKHLPLWNQSRIIDREGNWRTRRLKERSHMLGYSDQFSRPSIEMNTIGQPLTKARQKKSDMSNGKKKT